MRSIDCQHPPVLPSPLAAAFTDSCPFTFSRPSTAIRFHFRETASSLSLSLAVALFPLVFSSVLLGESGPRLFSVMAQLFVYMGSKKRFLMLRCHWQTRGRRTYCAEIESRSDIHGMQSRGNVPRGKISYGIGIFGTENWTMERNAG